MEEFNSDDEEWRSEGHAPSLASSYEEDSDGSIQHRPLVQTKPKLFK